MTLPDSPQDQGTRLAELADAAPKRSALASLSTAQKISITVISGLVLIALFFLIFSSSQTEYSVLYSGLSAEDAGRIVEHLKESGTKYKLTSGGTTIMVPSSRVYELRMELAAKGYPQGGGSGFELFDKTSFGATEFTQKVNYARALQGELARTISTLTPVDQARVHIVIPEDRLFTERQKPTTASIVLKLKPGAYMAEAQVRGIVHLVASAVQGLTVDNVTIIDTDGNLLWRGASASAGLSGAAGVGPMTTAQLEAKMTFEQEMQRRVETMLDRVLGIGKAVVRVSADINFDSTERESQIYQPTSDGRGIAITEQEISESRTGEPQASGYAGTPSNVEGYPGSVGGDGQSSTYSRSDRMVNYEVSKVVEKAVISPGKVERISVAAMVDGILTQDRMDAIRDVIAAAVGANPERGDLITVTGMEFARGVDDATLTALDEEARVAERNANIMRLIKYLTPAILGTLVLIFALAFLRTFRRREEADYDPEAAVGRSVDEVLAEGPESPALTPEEAAARLEEKRKVEMRKSVETLAKARPEDVARILETWMSED